MDNSKKKFKYRNLIVIYLLYVIFWIIILTIFRLIFKPPSPIALSRFIPLDDVFIELAFIFIIIFPLSGLIGLLLGGYLITPLILYLHKKIFGSKMHYGIQKTSDSEKIKFFSKGFFPMLMAINLSSIFLTPEVIQFILSANLISEIEVASNIPVLTRFFSEIILLTITFGLATMFFASIWFLNDSGIIYSDRKSAVNSDESIVLRPIGDWFQIILKGYASIAALMTYITIVWDFLTRYIENLGLPGNIFNIPSLILWLGMPFYLTISLIPALIFNDLIKKNRIRYIRKIGQKFGIKDTAIINLEFKKDLEI